MCAGIRALVFPCRQPRRNLRSYRAAAFTIIRRAAQEVDRESALGMEGPPGLAFLTAACTWGLEAARPWTWLRYLLGCPTTESLSNDDRRLRSEGLRSSRAIRSGTRDMHRHRQKRRGGQSEDNAVRFAARRRPGARPQGKPDCRRWHDQAGSPPLCREDRLAQR